MHGAVNNFLYAGFDAFANMKDKLDPTYNYYFWSSGLYGEPSKIMSWSGDWLFQLGIFGLIFVSYLLYISSDGSRIRRAELFLSIYFVALYVAFPLISMLLHCILTDRG